MLDEGRLLPILDMLSERAREFVHVSDRILDVEGALQSKDGTLPNEWQVVCTISSFINYIAERNRVRYGHFAFDMDPLNATSRKKDAVCTLDRMELFWNWQEDDVIDSLSEEQLAERTEIINAFLDNDGKIKDHLKTQPDIYAEGVAQEVHRDWMLRLRLLGEKERQLITDWKDLIEAQRASTQIPPGGTVSETTGP